MPKVTQIPVIDLFAGPGGLAEGFSSVLINKQRVFDIALSVEKDENAHKTLELRSFYRQFPVGKMPEEYYDLLKESDLKKRENKKTELFKQYKKEAQQAIDEAWLAELGNMKFPPEIVDARIEKALGGEKNWVLIGGPPCQAYSLVGRSRVGGVHEEDPRVYLYKEYLRIIAKHHPTVFVMENVKGLLSAKVNDEKVFHWMLKDLSDPGSVFRLLDSPEYKIYSLVMEDTDKDSDYLIKCEDYGIPQKRHRVILLGVRNDVTKIPGVLHPKNDYVSLEEVIGNLPELRSGINRKFLENVFAEGIKKRKYQNLLDSDGLWESKMNEFKNEIIHWNGFSNKDFPARIKAPQYGKGSEFISGEYLVKHSKVLTKWYHDPKLKGIPNHESRSHLLEDLKRYLFASVYTAKYGKFPRLKDYAMHGEELLPDHKNVKSGKFADRFRVQLPGIPATTVTSHISKDGHYFIHYDPRQCRSLTVREAARIQTFPDNYLFCGSRTQQFHQVGNAVPPLLAYQIANIVKNLF